MIRAVLVGLVCLVSVVVFPKAASAGRDSGNQNDTAEVSSSGEAVTVGVQRSGGSRRGARVSCLYSVFHQDAVPRRAVIDADSNAEFRYLRRHSCENSGNDATIRVPLAPASEVLLPALQDYVVSQLSKPEPVIEPLRPKGWVLVQVPMDFRATSDSWQPVTATAQIDAGPYSLWATMTATPVRLEMVPGDPRYPGEVVGCDGDEAIAPYVGEAPGSCSYTYVNSSAIVGGNHEFPSQFRTIWDVVYSTSDRPASQSLAVDPTITERPIAVAEVKGYVTCVGSSCGTPG